MVFWTGSGVSDVEKFFGFLQITKTPVAVFVVLVIVDFVVVTVSVFQLSKSKFAPYSQECLLYNMKNIFLSPTWLKFLPSPVSLYPKNKYIFRTCSLSISF